MSCPNGRAISSKKLNWRTLGLLIISFFLTAVRTVASASAFEVYNGRSSEVEHA